MCTASRPARVDDLVQAMGMARRSPRARSRGCAPRSTSACSAFLHRPIEGDWPYLWLDATYVKVRQDGRIVSVAAIIAVGVNSRRPARGARHGCRCQRGRDLLDRLPAQPRPARPARRQAGDLGCARGAQGGGRQGAARLLAALPRPLHAQCPGACRQAAAAAHRLRLDRHRLRPGRRRGRPQAVAPASPTSSGPGCPSSPR